LIVAAFSAILYSCFKDKDDNAKLLKRLVEISTDGTSATDFSYNGNEIKLLMALSSVLISVIWMG
jgi:hypothetical protein